MKFSFCSIAFRNQKITLQEIFYILSKVGYQGVELWANHLNNGIDLATIKKRLEQNNLSVPMISPYLDLTSDKVAWELSIKTAADYIQIAGFLEAPLVRAFTGTVGSRKATKIQEKNCTEGLKQICDIAAKQDIAIALETHPSTLVDNVYSTLTLLEKVKAPNLKLNLDIYHMFEVHRDPLLVLDYLFPYVAHVHAKNAILTPHEHHQEKHPLLHDPKPKAIFTGVKPLANGEMDYEPFVKELINRGFDGYLSVEWFGKKPEEAAVAELEYINSITESYAAIASGGSTK